MGSFNSGSFYHLIYECTYCICLAFGGHADRQSARADDDDHHTEKILNSQLNLVEYGNMFGHLLPAIHMYCSILVQNISGTAHSYSFNKV